MLAFGFVSFLIITMLVVLSDNTTVPAATKSGCETRCLLSENERMEEKGERESKHEGQGKGRRKSKGSQTVDSDGQLNDLSRLQCWAAWRALRTEEKRIRSFSSADVCSEPCAKLKIAFRKERRSEGVDRK